MALWQLMHLGTWCTICISCFCEIRALCVSWITYDHFYYAPWLACWALFGSLVPAMCNRTSCAQVHELPQSHCGDNREGTLFSWLHIYYAHLAFVRFEHSITLLQYIYFKVTLFSHSHNLSQLLLLDYCHEYKQPTQLWTCSMPSNKKPE